uniref:Ribonuclease H n=1 Tax=Parastrongyloides trichosuri TaxID=131310 RepID=A0A0N4Z1Q8_PARTI
MGESKDSHSRNISEACVLWLGTFIDCVPNFEEYSVEKYQQKKENKVYMRNKVLLPNWIYAIDGSTHYMSTCVASIAGITFQYPESFTKFLKVHGQRIDDDNYYLILSALKLSSPTTAEKLSGMEKYDNQVPEIRYIQYLIAAVSLNRAHIVTSGGSNDLITDVGNMNPPICPVNNIVSDGRMARRSKDDKRYGKKTFERAKGDVNVNRENLGGAHDGSNRKDVETASKLDSEKISQAEFEKWLIQAASSGQENGLPRKGYDNLEYLIKDIALKKRSGKYNTEGSSNLQPHDKSDLQKRSAQNYHGDKQQKLRKQSKGKKRSSDICDNSDRK